MNAGRHLRIAGLGLFALTRRPVHVTGIVIVYSLLVAIAASIFLYVDAMRAEARRLLGDGPDLIVQRLAGGRHDTIPLARMHDTAAIRGVASVVPRVWGYLFDAPSGVTLTVWGLASLPDAELRLDEGSIPVEGECLVGRGFADVRLLEIGERLPLRAANGELFAPRVAGVFTSDSAILTNDLLVVTAADARSLFSIPADEATDFAVRLHNPQEAGTVSQKILERWADSRTISHAQLIATYDAIFDWRGGIWAAVLLLLAAAFAVLVWDTASGMTNEEYRMLGLLKAVGWSARELMEFRVWQGAIVSILSCTTGLLLALIHVVLFDGSLIGRAIKGWSVLYPTFPLRPQVDGYVLLFAMALSVIPYTAATLIPAWRASVSDPDDVMRT